MSVEKFQSPGSRITGAAVVLLAMAAVVLVAIDGITQGEAVAICIIGLTAMLAWVSMVRPMLLLDETTLTVRNMFDTLFVPVRDVTEVLVRRYTVISAGERTINSNAVSRGLRQLVRARQPGPNGSLTAPTEEHPSTVEYAQFVTDRILSQARAARENEQPGRDIRRVLAWPEIVLTVAFAAGLVVALLV